MGRLYVGTSGWCGLHPKDFARHYDAVEFNWTFHERDSDVEHYRKNRKHPDFFVQKAIGWALRQHAHYDPEWVRQFLVKHGDGLARLSHREASKHLT